MEADGSYDFSYDDPDAEEVPDITVWVKRLKIGMLPVCGHGLRLTERMLLQPGPAKHWRRMLPLAEKAGARLD